MTLEEKLKLLGDGGWMKEEVQVEVEEIPKKALYIHYYIDNEYYHHGKPGMNDSYPAKANDIITGFYGQKWKVLNSSILVDEEFYEIYRYDIHGTGENICEYDAEGNPITYRIVEDGKIHKIVDNKGRVWKVFPCQVKIAEDKKLPSDDSYYDVSDERWYRKEK